MPLQTLTLKLDGITAGDYLTWCRDPDPPALDFALRSISIDADPLGDTITASLDWAESLLPASAAAAAAGLPLTAGVHIHPGPTQVPHTHQASPADPEERPATPSPRDHTRACALAREASADQRSRRHLRHASEVLHAAEDPAPDSSSETPLRHELALALTDLGGATFVLAHHGALTDNRLESRVRRIHDLYERLDAVAHATYSRPRDDDQAEYLAA